MTISTLNKAKNGAGQDDLAVLLRSLNVRLDTELFVFCSAPRDLHQRITALSPIATFIEREGVSFIVTQNIADRERFEYFGVFRRLSLEVHSSLNAVGLTAALSAALTKLGISVNVVAAFYHDHLFVPHERALEALTCLQGLSGPSEP